MNNHQTLTVGATHYFTSVGICVTQLGTYPWEYTCKGASSQPVTDVQCSFMSFHTVLSLHWTSPRNIICDLCWHGDTSIAREIPWILTHPSFTVGWYNILLARWYLPYSRFLWPEISTCSSHFLWYELVKKTLVKHALTSSSIKDRPPISPQFCSSIPPAGAPLCLPFPPSFQVRWRCNPGAVGDQTDASHGGSDDDASQVVEALAISQQVVKDLLNLLVTQH